MIEKYLAFVRSKEDLYPFIKAVTDAIHLPTGEP